jgi:hypothetical protein
VDAAGRIVAAYRDRYAIDSTSAVGVDAVTDAQRLDASRARQAVRRAADIADHATSEATHQPAHEATGVS